MAGGRFFVDFGAVRSAQVFPVVQVMALIVFVIPWFIYCLFLASSGEMETVKGARQMVYDETTFKAGWYMIFVYFWFYISI